MFYKDFTRNPFKLKDLAQFSRQVLDSIRPLGEGVYLALESHDSKWEF
jgi:hypothetical protein